MTIASIMGDPFFWALVIINSVIWGKIAWLTVKEHIS
jgi:hypothetical protein